MSMSLRLRWTTLSWLAEAPGRTASSTAGGKKGSNPATMIRAPTTCSRIRRSNDSPDGRASTTLTRKKTAARKSRM